MASARGRLQITVHGVGGEQVELQMAPSSDVADLKERVAEKLDIPIECQHVIVGTAVLADADKLSKRASAGALTVTVLLSLDKVHKDLLGRSPHARQTAVKVLTKLGRRGGDASVSALSQCLGDQNMKVRKAALTALPEMADRGHPDVVSAVVKLLKTKQEANRSAYQEDDERQIRIITMSLLDRLANRGDPEVIAGVVTCLGNRSREVRDAALQALGVVANRGNEVATSELLAELESPDPEVRCALLQAIGQVAAKGNSPVVEAVRRRMEDTSERVRTEALHVLGIVAEDGGDRVLMEVVALVEQGDDEACVAALAQLSQVASVGEGKAVTAVVKCLGRESPAVRSAALQTLGEISGKDSEGVVEGVAGCLGDEDPTLRGQAVAVLPRVASRGNAIAVAAACKCLQHPSEDVVSTGLLALCDFSQRGDASVMQVVALLEDERSEVRKLAGSSLGKLSLEGDVDAINAVCTLVAHKQACVRETALRVLPLIARKGDERAIRGVAAHLQHEDLEVRGSAMLGLISVADRSDERLILAAAQVKELTGKAKTTAWELLVELAERANDVAIAALGALLRDEDAALRSTVAQLLSSVTAEHGRTLQEAALSCIQSREPSTRHMAVRALSCAVGVGNGEAVQALLQRLDSPDSEVRATVLLALVEVALRGDGEVVSAVSQRLDSWDVPTLCTGVMALALLSEKDHEPTLMRITKLLSHPASVIRRAALYALPEAVDRGLPAHPHASQPGGIEAVLRWSRGDPGHEAAVNLALTGLDDTSASVRHVAIVALIKLVRKVEDGLMIPLHACLDGVAASVVCTAAEALQLLAAGDDDRLMHMASVCLQHPAWEVRRAAWCAFRGRAGQASPAAAKQSSQDCVKADNQAALDKVTRQGEPSAIKALVAKSQTQDPILRRLSFQALSLLGGPESEQTLSAATAGLEDTTEDVREAASQCVRRLARQPGGAAVAAPVCQRIQQGPTLATIAGLILLPDVAERGNEDAVAVVVGCLKHESPDVRRAAVDSLAQVARVGDKHTISLVSKRLQHPDQDVRQAAILSICKIAPKGDEHTVALLTRLQSEHQDPDVRQSARVALDLGHQWQ